MLVHFHVTALVQRHPGLFKVQLIDGPAATRGKQRRFHRQRVSGLQRDADTIRRPFDLGGAFAQIEINAELSKAFAEALRDFAVEEGQHAVAAIDERHLDAQRSKNRRIFAADDSTAHNRHAARNRSHPEYGVRIKNHFVVERNFRRAMGRGASGDQDHLGSNTGGRMTRPPYRNRIGIFERSHATHQFHAVRDQVLQDFLALRFDDHIFAMHEVFYGQPFLQRIIDAVEPALLHAGKVQRGFAQDFARNGAGIHTSAAQQGIVFDQRDAFAEIGGLGRALFAGRPRTDHD